jgi:hypothetical protein
MCRTAFLLGLRRGVSRPSDCNCENALIQTQSIWHACSSETVWNDAVVLVIIALAQNRSPQRPCGKSRPGARDRSPYGPKMRLLSYAAH